MLQGSASFLQTCFKCTSHTEILLQVFNFMVGKEVSFLVNARGRNLVVSHMKKSLCYVQDVDVTLFNFHCAHTLA